MRSECLLYPQAMLHAMLGDNEDVDAFIHKDTILSPMISTLPSGFVFQEYNALIHVSHITNNWLLFHWT